jgi:3-hydroxymyristoyl/3-hydroxydecanoyl-(acyl carrier protein) dehydratase
VDQAVEIRFAEDHPTAAGHFPGNPIIPGAVLLDAVLLALSGRAAAGSCTIKAAKFLRPVRPGDRMRIEWETKGDAIHFRCLLPASHQVVATGQLRLGDKTI